jgi:hypothetical protein
MTKTRLLCGLSALSLLICGTVGSAPAATTANQELAVGPQYDTTHVYVAADDFDRFVTSFKATFGGTATKQGEFQVTPTPSTTKSQLVLTPSGSVSVFGFTTPIPVPFGDERNGYLVNDLDAAVASAMLAGAVRTIETFPDPVGRDVVVQWPGGVNMQLYWHTKAPSYPALAHVPENRVYLTPEAANRFVAAWTQYSHGRVVSDDKAASGAEVGQPGKAIRRVVIESAYGSTVVLVSDNQLPWPFGRDMTGYAVDDLRATLAKATASGAEVLVQPYRLNGREGAMVRFPGGYIAEIHSADRR